MRIDPAVVQEVASEVVLQLVLDGDIRVFPLRVPALERNLAAVMRAALLREDALSRIARFGRELGDQGFDSRVRGIAERTLPTRTRSVGSGLPDSLSRDGGMALGRRGLRAGRERGEPDAGFVD